MNKKNNIICRQGNFSTLAFTLVEIMIAITIFMIVMVSVLQIFGISVNITNKVDINRQVQENIKNLTETLAEDIRQN
jgi:type II secretory pathway pseudopilin PulG